MNSGGVKTAAIIGGGLIGESWAALFAAHGVKVRAFDPSPAVRDGFKNRALAKVADLVGDEAFTVGDIQVFSSQSEAVEGVDFIQENAPEIAALKQKIFSQFESDAPLHAIFASSTSSLTWGAFSSQMKEPERAIVAHPFNPPHLLPLVEIYGVDETVVANAWAFYECLGHSPIRIRKEAPGHIANRLSSALFREAVHIIAEGIADVEDVDKALKSGLGARWAAIGVFLGYHLGGGDGGIRHYLKHLGPSQEARWESLGRPRLTSEVCEAIASAMEDIVGDTSIAELEALRNKRLRAFRRN